MPTLKDIRRALDMAGIDHRGYLDRHDLKELYYNDASGYICPRRPGHPTTSVDGRWARPVAYPGEKQPSRPQSARMYRRQHHHVVKQDHCHMCHQMIEKDDAAKQVHQKRYHERCCVCNTCGKELFEGTVLEKDGALWCQECTNDAIAHRAPKCPKCYEPVLKGVKIRGQMWHRECVRCSICEKHLVSLKSKKKHEHVPHGKDGRQYCQHCMEEHFGEKCTSCGVPVLKYNKNVWTGESLCEDCSHNGFLVGQDAKYAPRCNQSNVLT